MKISITRRELKRLLAAVKLVVPSRSTVAVLQHVLLRAEMARVTIHATDLQEYLSGEVECDVQEPGSALLPMQTLKDLAKGKAADEVSIMLNGENELTITTPVAGQMITQQVPTIAVTEWPEMPAADIPMQPTNTTEMLGAYARVLPAISVDPTRYALHGVYAGPEHGELVATDGRRMFIASAAVQAWPESIWPSSKVLAGDLLHDANGQMAVLQKAEDETVVVITANGWQYQSKCVAAKYPQYRNVVLGSHQFSRSMDLAADTALVKQAISGFGLGKKDEVCLYIDGAGVRLVHAGENGCVHVDLPNTQLDGDLGDGEHIVLGWYAGQLLDTLAAGYTQIRIQSDAGDHKPVRCDSSDDSGCAIVMPLRLGPETSRRIAERCGTAPMQGAEPPTSPDTETTGPQPDPPAMTDPTPTNNEDTPDMNDTDTNPTASATEQPVATKPNLTMVPKPEPADPIAELEALVTDSLASLQDARDHLTAVKKQIKAVKADHKQKERDTRSTQLLLDKLKNAAGF